MPEIEIKDPEFGIFIDGLHYPAITRITPGLDKTILELATKIGLEKALEAFNNAKVLGGDVHKYIELFYTKKLGSKFDISSNPDKFNNCIDKFHQMQDLFQIEPLYIEHVVYSKSKRYAGIVDIIGLTKDGELILPGDFKTSSSGKFYGDYYLQGEALYRAVIEMSENGHIKLPKGTLKKPIWMICLHKTLKKFNPDKHIVRLDPKDSRFNAFLGLLEHFNWKKEREGE